MGKTEANSGRMTVQIDKETHRALQSYSELTDIPIGNVLARAVREWMNTVGLVHIEVMTGQNKGLQRAVLVAGDASADEHRGMGRGY